MSATGFSDAPGRYRLITMRSNDQFNTTIYGYSDRMRGIEGTRDVLLINPDDMRRAGLYEGQIVSLVSDAEDGVHREVSGLKVTPFLLPDGCIGSYYPEMNPLAALSHHDQNSKTPAGIGSGADCPYEWRGAPQRSCRMRGKARCVGRRPRSSPLHRRCPPGALPSREGLPCAAQPAAVPGFFAASSR